MAASLNNNNMLALPEHQYQEQPLRRGPGRRKKNGAEQQKKKLERPRRGMGVEKLEMMIKGEETSKSPSPFSFSAAGADMNGGYGSNKSFQYLGGFGSQNVGHVVPQIGLGFNHMAIGHVVCGGGHEISAELPSNPNSKKKRYDGAGGLDLMGLNVGGNLNFNDHHNQKMLRKEQNYGLFQTPNLQHLVPQVGYATRPGHPGVEVLAVHKKGGGMSTNQETGSSYVMEYDFFSAAGSNRNKEEESRLKNKADHNDQLLMMMDHRNYFSEQNDPEISLGIGAGTTSTSSSSIDLSLKLSYQ